MEFWWCRRSSVIRRRSKGMGYRRCGTQTDEGECAGARGCAQRPGKQVLACASTNIAVDNIVEGLLDLGVKVVRVGRPIKIREELRHVCLDVQVQSSCTRHSGLAAACGSRPTQKLEHPKPKLEPFCNTPP